jgi:hypothetical protein
MIDNVLLYNETIWHVGREKIKFQEKYHSKTFCANVVMQIEGHRQCLHDLQLRIVKRQIEETEAIHSERYVRMMKFFSMDKLPARHNKDRQFNNAHRVMY